MNRRNHFFVLSIIILFLTINLPIHAQEEPPIKWGEIPRADLEMKSFPQDTNASALILCDYGESHLDDDLNVIYTRHLRVKIFTTKGYDWGTRSVGLYTEKHAESLEDIEGATYWLDEKGNIESQELKSRDIFEEDIDGSHTRYKFTLPALKPGCVIEMKYKIKSESLMMMKGWVFQYDEPVRWSEYRMRVPQNIAYTSVTRGFEPFAIYDKEEVTQVFSGQAKAILGKDIFPCTLSRWAVQDAAAIREEPFITTTDDYVNQVEVQLSGYFFPNYGKKQILNDWPTFVRELQENKYFCKNIDDTKQVKKTAEEITKGLSATEDKVKAIYDWVAKSIVCTGGNTFMGDQEPDDILESKKGNNAEITFLLLSLFKSMDIKADPVILSTRGNGRIQDSYPIYSQFNYVLARVNLGGKWVYLDATDPLRTMDMLPMKVLNVRGLVIKEPMEWVTLNTDKRYVDNSLTRITLSEDGSFKGTVEDVYLDYAALRIRGSLKDKKDIDLAKDLLETEKHGITLDSVSIEGKDSLASSLKIKASISSSSYASNAGDMIYINPHMINRMNENPLKAKIRRYPMDFSLRTSYKNYISIAIPDSFEVKETINNISLTSGAGTLTYSRQVQVENNNVNVLYKFDIKEIEAGAKFYEQIREFYSRIVASNAEHLVLSRKKKPVEVVQTVPVTSENVPATNKDSGKSAESKNVKGKKKK